MFVREHLDMVLLKQPLHSLTLRKVIEIHAHTHIEQFEANWLTVCPIVDPTGIVQVPAVGIGKVSQLNVDSVCVWSYSIRGIH